MGLCELPQRAILRYLPPSRAGPPFIGDAVLSSPATSLPALAKYELFEEIGHGGMATVYRARDLRLGREVAVKIIHRHLRENREVAARFASEALAVAKVKHPNIVEVYDVSEGQDDERYLVVELVRGKTLRQLMTERGFLPAEIAAAIGLEICAGLGHAHRQGVIHRDVKPENVLIQLDAVASDSDSADGAGGEPARIKITDFGIAKLLDAQGVTSTGQVLGSPAHMAPEQIEGGDVDARSDVFGVGVLLYECMVGALPFAGQNPAQVLRRVLEGTFTPADRARPTVGAQWSEVLSRALSHHPGDRYADTLELAAALRQVLVDLDFPQPRVELGRYLASPEKYLETYQGRILRSLSQAGQGARETGDVPRAAAFFNRALSFKPDDTLLLAEVAGLARKARNRRRLLRYGSVGLVASAFVGLGAWLLSSDKLVGGVERSSSAIPETTGPRPQTPKPEVTQARAPSHVEEPQGPDAAEPAPARPTEQRSRQYLNRPKKPAPTGSETREVRTLVVGPQNAKVRIDGQLEPWFKNHQLSVGPHTFEFVPPNTECCEVTPPMTVQIEAGEGAQVVRGTIPFKAAQLRHDGPAGSRASCGVLGQLSAGQVKDVPMTRASMGIECTVFPPPGSAEEPKRIDVTLQPGRTFAVNGS